MGFSIEIDANTKSIAKSMSELKADLVSFKGQLEKATDTQTISRLNKSIRDTDAALKGIKAFDGGRIAKEANTAGISVNNLSRIAQDAPFGFIAIQNNLDPLFQSFRQLTTELGSTKAAFKAFGSALIGSAGLGLAFNLVTSAITYFSMNMKKSSSDVEDADKKFQDFVKTIKSVSDISNDAIGSNTGQIAIVRALGAAVLDTNRSLVERQRALTELKQINKSYFGDLKLESDIMPKLTAAIQEYANAIIATAKVKGLSEEISRLNIEFLKEDRTLQNLKTKYDQARNAVDNFSGAKDLLVDGEVVQSSAFLATQKVLKDSEASYKSQRDKVEQLGVSMALLNGDVQAAVGNQLKYKDVTNDTSKKIDELARRISALKDIQGENGLSFEQRGELTSLEIQLANRDDVVKLGFTPQELKEKVQFIIGKYVPHVEFEPQLIAKPKLLTEGVKFDIAKAVGLGDVITPPAMTIAPPPDINADPFAKALGEAFGDSIAVVAENIGKSFASGDFLGGLKDMANGILTILGDVLINIGKQLIATSVLVKAVKSALRGLFGPGGDAAALAVGVGLVAFGSLLKNMKFEGPKLADGAVVSGSTIANIGEAGTEVVAPLTKLPYLLNQAGAGGGGGMVVGLRVKGRELIAMLEREKSFAKRLG